MTRPGNSRNNPRGRRGGDETQCEVGLAEQRGWKSVRTEGMVEGSLGGGGGGRRQSVGGQGGGERVSRWVRGEEAGSQ